MKRQIDERLAKLEGRLESQVQQLIDKRVAGAMEERPDIPRPDTPRLARFCA